MRRLAVSLLLPLLPIAALTACSSSGSSDTTVAVSAAAAASATDAPAASAAAADTTAAGEASTILDDAAVAKDLTAMVTLVKAAAASAATGGEAADAASTAMYDQWYAFEATVRKKDQAQYLDMEDALVAVKAGSAQKDGAKAAKGATDFEALATAYLQKFPASTAGGAVTASTAVTTPPVAGRPVAVQLADYAIIVKPTLQAGPTTFTISNIGQQIHEFVVFRTDLAPDALPKDSEGGVEEKGAGLTFVDEHENVKPGTTATLTVDLKPGKYVFVCNMLGHYAKGMRTAVTVQ